MPQCSVDPKTLAAIIRNPDQPDFPSSATHYVLTRIAAIDARFANGIERQFAAAVIQAGFETAIEDRKYFEAVKPHLLLGMAKDVAETKRNTEELKEEVSDIKTTVSDLLREFKSMNREKLESKITSSKSSFSQGVMFSEKSLKKLVALSGSDSFDHERIVLDLEIKISQYEARINALHNLRKGGDDDK